MADPQGARAGGGEVILENRTRYRSADLERVILLALQEAGIERHGRDRVVIAYGSSVMMSGWCYKGTIKRWNGHARMRLRLPRPSPAGATDGWRFDFAQFVWLVRHEVGHWRGLEHSQMAASLLYWSRDEKRRNDGPVGSELPPPAWSIGMSVAIENEEPDLRKPRPTADAKREAKVAHARAMLDKAEIKTRTAAMLVKRWQRRLLAAERSIVAAARRAR